VSRQDQGESSEISAPAILRKWNKLNNWTARVERHQAVGQGLAREIEELDKSRAVDRLPPTRSMKEGMAGATECLLGLSQAHEAVSGQIEEHLKSIEPKKR
jgi:hypothetical protein